MHLSQYQLFHSDTVHCEKEYFLLSNPLFHLVVLILSPLIILSYMQKLIPLSIFLYKKYQCMLYIVKYLSYIEKLTITNLLPEYVY